MLLLIALVIGGAVIGKLWWDYDQKQKHERYKLLCWNQYQWALQHMHVDPRARANVVNLGRQYYGALRGAVTIYDEMAISNDIKQAGG